MNSILLIRYHIRRAGRSSKTHGPYPVPWSGPTIDYKGISSIVCTLFVDVFVVMFEISGCKYPAKGVSYLLKHLGFAKCKQLRLFGLNQNTRAESVMCAAKTRI
jgi:hypothetical protein